MVGRCGSLAGRWSVAAIIVAGLMIPVTTAAPALASVSNSQVLPRGYSSGHRFTTATGASVHSLVSLQGKATSLADAWSTAQEVLPGSVTFNSAASGLTSISCPSSGSCGAGGSYSDSSGNVQAFVVDEVNGTWGQALAVPGLTQVNTGGDASILSVSCTTAGNCSAGGYYTNGAANAPHAFVVDEVNGTWGTALEVPGIQILPPGSFDAETTAISCASPGNCSGGGYYSTGVITEAFVVSEVNGVWGTALQVPGSSALNSNGRAETLSISCGSPGNCSAGGYVDDSGFLQAFVVDELGGTWKSAIEMPGIQALNTDVYSGTNTIACQSAGNCTAGGYFTDASGMEPFVASEVNGIWGQAASISGATPLDAGNGAFSVSCVSSGNCTAGGGTFVASEVSGTWGAAKQLPGLAALSTGYADISSVSCGSAGNCAAGGLYQDNSGQQAFVAQEVNGTWGAAEEVPGLAELNNGFASTSAMSCAPGSTCSAGGFYADGNNFNQAFVVGQTVARSSATALNLSAATVTYGNEQAEQLSVTVSSAGTPTGTVTVAAGSTTLCAITLVSGTGSCSLRATQLPAGSYRVIASYGGDASTSPSVSPSQALTVSKATSATAVDLSAATLIQGNEQVEKISATATSAGSPTGTITVTAGATQLCTVTLASGSGSCKLQASELPVGTYQVTGSYSGDANTSPSVSPPQILTVQPRQFTIQPSTNYAGWSVHPSTGLVHTAQAEWKVPAVTCGAIGSPSWYLSRAAVWAGMWGPISGLSTTDWLPQAGTVSLCHDGISSYVAFYELFHKGAKGPITLSLPVNAGDTIKAVVAYKGKNSKNQLLFHYLLTNVTQNNATTAGNMPPTSAGVPLADAAFQGGMIVENQPATKVCVRTDPITGQCLQYVNGGGLSRFMPISATEPFTTVNGNKLSVYSGYDTLFRWDMVSATTGGALAATGPITPQGFTVTWNGYS